MKDQFKLLRDCIHNDIPAIVFQGDDKCLPEILNAAIEIYRQNGCSEEFLYDLGLLQAESPETVKLPRLSPVEKVLVKEEIIKRSKL